MKDNKQKDWAHLIELFLNKDERMSPAVFCKMHDVTIYEMDLHYKEYIKDKMSNNQTSCIEITVPSKKSSYLILDVDGIRIKINHGFDHSLLKEIIEVIKC